VRPEEFKALRARTGMTQVEIGADLGVDARTVQRWEAGEYPIPPPVERLLGILTDPDWRLLKAAKGEPMRSDIERLIHGDERDPLEQEIKTFNDRLKAARARGPEVKAATPRSSDIVDGDPLGRAVAAFNETLHIARAKKDKS
jgi:transcriptional regulator with XRE-family HTH domain